MGGGEFGDGSFDGGAEVGERGVIATVNRATLQEPPEPFDQVQLWRVGGQKQERDFQLRGERLHGGVSLRTGIVQDQPPPLG